MFSVCGDQRCERVLVSCIVTKCACRLVTCCYKCYILMPLWLSRLLLIAIIAVLFLDIAMLPFQHHATCDFVASTQRLVVAVAAAAVVVVVVRVVSPA